MGSAKLEVSPCGRFAKLINSAEEYFLVWSKPHARYMVESGLEHSVITTEDAVRLCSQIDLSHLPDLDELVPLEVQEVIFLLNSNHFESPENQLDVQMVVDHLNRVHKVAIN